MPRLPLILTAAALGLAACGDLPDLRPGTRPGPAVTTGPVIDPAPIQLGPDGQAPGNGRSAAAAEAACVAAGQERGFTVQGVVGSSDVAGGDGLPASRDVMLRVARGAQIFDLRCNFHYASAQARVMAL